MSIFKVRFIKEVDDSPEKHLVTEVEAKDHHEAFQKAIKKLKDKEWLGIYNFHSVEIEHF